MKEAQRHEGRYGCQNGLALSREGIYKAGWGYENHIE